MIKFSGLLLFISISFSSWAQADTLQHPFKKDTVLLPIDTVKNGIDTLTILIDSTKLNDSLILTGKVLKGIASFYSANLDGTKTATGEVFRNSKLTGASNNLKLNTWVKVTNLKNGKTVVVRINDRMHPSMKKKGRVIDLSRSAAKKLDFMKEGLTKVKLEVIDPPKK
jgi:rare lipoprotein A (peptidoglycan hydrolase)